MKNDDRKKEHGVNAERKRINNTSRGRAIAIRTEEDAGGRRR